jgi:hypothetical protein
LDIKTNICECTKRYAVILWMYCIYLDRPFTTSIHLHIYRPFPTTSLFHYYCSYWSWSTSHKVARLFCGMIIGEHFAWSRKIWCWDWEIHGHNHIMHPHPVLKFPGCGNRIPLMWSLFFCEYPLMYSFPMCSFLRFRCMFPDEEARSAFCVIAACSFIINEHFGFVTLTGKIQQSPHPCVLPPYSFCVENELFLDAAALRTLHACSASRAS